MKTAKFVEAISAKADLYELSEPISYTYLDGDNRSTAKTKYVAVSCVNVPFSGPETYIFPADMSGEILSYLEINGSLNGSLRGEFNTKKALRGLGFKLEETKYD